MTVEKYLIYRVLSPRKQYNDRSCHLARAANYHGATLFLGFLHFSMAVAKESVQGLSFATPTFSDFPTRLWQRTLSLSKDCFQLRQELLSPLTSGRHCRQVVDTSYQRQLVKPQSFIDGGRKERREQLDQGG
jgi:hypothetical protein